MTAPIQDIKIVDGLALFFALEKQAQSSSGYGLTSVKFCIEGPDDDNMRIEFTVERYAMDGVGYHVGTEVFTGTFPLLLYSDIGQHGITPDSAFYTVTAGLDVESIEPAQEPHDYTVLDAAKWLIENDTDTDEWVFDPDILQIAFDNGMGEGDYSPPDDDFAFQELDHALAQAMKDLPIGRFELSDVYQHRHWVIEFDDGTRCDTTCLDCGGCCFDPQGVQVA